MYHKINYVEQTFSQRPSLKRKQTFGEGVTLQEGVIFTHTIFPPLSVTTKIFIPFSFSDDYFWEF